MFITKKHLSRRTFMRGTLGATVALPFLDAMVPALSAAPKSPFRFGAVYFPCGVFPDYLASRCGGEQLRVQAGDAAAGAVPQSAGHGQQDEGAVGLVGPSGRQLGVPERRWAGRAAATARQTLSERFESKKTVDQFIADQVAGDTPLRSIEVGTEDMGTAVGACDGFACTFFNTLSWRDDSSPLPVGINPRVTFERMFGETDSTERRFARLKEKQSLLDSVTEETAKLKRSLGAPDRAILDEYLGNIRDVEQQLERMESRLGTITGNPEAPVGLPEAFDDHMNITYNLMHLAYQGDISRVFTFMTGHEASDRAYAHIGIPEQHHTISHHGNDPEKLAKYAKIATYQIVKFADFLDKLKATKEGDGTLLDHAVLYWGSGMSNGNAHDRNSPPAVIVGGGSGRLKGNRHIVAKDTPTANLLLAMAHVGGAEIDKLGASTGRIDL